MTTYSHPANGAYNETTATLDDGRVMTVNTQYNAVLPHGKHAADCDQINKMGGRCTCGMLAGVDVAALIADARINGRFGRAPVAKVKAPVVAEPKHGAGWCDKCESYCFGDCQS